MVFLRRNSYGSQHKKNHYDVILYILQTEDGEAMGRSRPNIKFTLPKMCSETTIAVSEGVGGKGGERRSGRRDCRWRE